VSSDEAYEEGYDAYWDGVDVSGNPYDEDTNDRRSWEEGWIAARNHDYDESEG
jgi:ribosome modulation factor